jgi:peroxiredoxin family protein
MRGLIRDIGTEEEVDMKRLAIVVRDDAYDRLLTPLAFAWFAAEEGVEVDMLFVLWAVRVLTEDGARSVRIEGRHAAEEEAMRNRMIELGEPTEILDYLRMLRKTGKVRFYACHAAAETFDVSESNLLPEAEGIVSSMWFLKEKALEAGHCQYF